MDEVSEVKRISKMMIERIKNGKSRYGDGWKRKDNLKEADEELADFFNYFIMESCKRKPLVKRGTKLTLIYMDRRTNPPHLRNFKYNLDKITKEAVILVDGSCIGLFDYDPSIGRCVSHDIRKV